MVLPLDVFIGVSFTKRATTRDCPYDFEKCQKIGIKGLRAKCAVQWEGNDIDHAIAEIALF